MLWTILSRTIQSVFGIGGLMMEAFGIYFNIMQIAETPKGPFGWSILVWGVILFTLSSISVIIQLLWHIHEIEGSYLYALSCDGLQGIPNWKANQLRLALVFSNTLDRPLEYEVDIDKTYLEIEGKRPTQLRYESVGSVIPKLKTNTFILPEIDSPQNYPALGVLHYEVEYGRPGKMRFLQRAECTLEFTHPTQEGSLLAIPIVKKDKYKEDKPIKK